MSPGSLAYRGPDVNPQRHPNVPLPTSPQTHGPAENRNGCPATGRRVLGWHLPCLLGEGTRKSQGHNQFYAAKDLNIHKQKGRHPSCSETSVYPAGLAQQECAWGPAAAAPSPRSVRVSAAATARSSRPQDPRDACGGDGHQASGSFRRENASCFLHTEFHLIFYGKPREKHTDPFRAYLLWPLRVCSHLCDHLWSLTCHSLTVYQAEQG